MAKQRVIQFKKIEEDKLLNETKRTHEEQVIFYFHIIQKLILEREQREELDRFNERWDQEFYEMNTRFNNQEQKLQEIHKNEMTEKLEEFEKSYPQYPKPSNEVLNLNKILEQAVKIKEYSF